jgi:hypothetical protein
MSRKRKVTLTDDKKKNVTSFACARLNKAVNSIRVFGQCYGGKYDWTDEQIDKAETALKEATVKAIDQIKSGSGVCVAGISL